MKRPHSPSPELTDALEPPESPRKSKKLKELDAYSSTSPFPEFVHPTPSEARQVFGVLADAHNGRDLIRKAPSPTTSSNSAKTCGHSHNVIDALIGTILSQNTSGKNSSTAKRSLDTTFGRNNFAAIADAPKADVVEAIRMGGMANKKAATIQKLLQDIKAKRGEHSLQYLAEMVDGKPKYSDPEVMRDLVSFDGVGPKTASCVLLFCLGRDSFAVDTHVYRLSKLLGWVPPKANRVLAQAHLDLKIPDELKYGLHVLMIRHGRACKGCNASKDGTQGVCILKAYLRDRNVKVEPKSEGNL
ncbi:DNA glycosylase [Pleurotus eryngii]|uniref:DNA glycosylase n=1 Tax=Pleurotus eryngii TaxID=5323 RepID=A0A9P6DI02_PLEER|nr:DNA glycosylase [Pleurotus eryngii]